MRQLLVAALVGWLFAGIPGRASADPTEDAANRLLMLLEGDGNQFVRDGARDALRKMGEKAVESLRKSLDCEKNCGWKNETFAAAVATILGEIGPEAEGAVNELTAAVDEKNAAPQGVREAAIMALGKIFKRPADPRTIAYSAVAETLLKAAQAAKELEQAAAVENATKEPEKRKEQIEKAKKAAKAADEAAKAAVDAKNAAQAWSASNSEGTNARADADSLKKALEALQTSAESVKSASNSLAADVTKSKDKLTKAIEVAREAVGDLKSKMGVTDLTAPKQEAEERSAAINIAVKALTKVLKDNPFQLTILATEALGRIFGDPEEKTK